MNNTVTKLIARSLAGVLTVLIAAAILSISSKPVGAVGEERKVTSSNPLSGDKQAIKEGKPLYRARCAFCHGLRANGRGRGLPNSADLTKFKRGYSKFVDTVKNGWKTMPAWGGMGELSDEEINQIGAYLETLAGRKANWSDQQGNAQWPQLDTALLMLINLFVAEALAAEGGYQEYLDRITTAGSATPDGIGLLTLIEQETRIAQEHAGLAVGDLEDLENIQLHTRHVRHAIDPAKESEGPGKGFGVCPAAREVIRYMELARDAADATESVTTQAEQVLASAGNIVFWCGKILDKAGQILGGASPVASAFFAEETVEHLNWILAGRDANEDGTISWEKEEGGLAQIKTHLNVIQ